MLVKKARGATPRRSCEDHNAFGVVDPLAQAEPRLSSSPQLFRENRSVNKKEQAPLPDLF
jgi:hypothetical protein